MSVRGHTGGTRPRGRPPLGIAIYCVLGVIGTVITLLNVAVLIDQGGTLALLGYAAGAFSVLYFFVLIGLWTLRSWAWTAGIIIVAFDIVVHAVTLNLVLVLVLSVLWIYLYLKRPLYKS
jgi:hypothetical protein